MSTSQPKPPLLPLGKPPGYRDPCSSPTPRPRPPPKPVALPPSFHRDQRRCCCYRAFCCILLIAMAILALILSAACAIFYLWFQPRLPEIRVKSIDYAVSSPLGLTPDSWITTRLQIQNPNRNLKMVYGKSKVLLRGVYKDGGAVLGDGTVSGFTQETNNVTALEIRTKVGRDEVLNSYEGGEEVEKGLKSKKNLLVNVEIRSGVGIKGKDRWSTGIVKVKLVCEGMRLSRGKLNGGKESKCPIRILDW